MVQTIPLNSTPTQFLGVFALRVHLHPPGFSIARWGNLSQFCSCLSKHRSDLRENFTTDVSLDKEELAKFWRSFASRSGSKKHSCSSTLWDRACFHNSAQDSGSGPNLLCDRLSWFNPLLNCTLNPCTSLYFPFGRGVYCPSALVWTCCAHPNSFDVDTVYLLLYVTTVSV